MDIWSSLLVSVLAALVFETLVYFVAIAKKDGGLADVAWGPGFVVIILAHIYLLGEISFVSQVTLILASLWAFRLATHIFTRNHGKGEDFRYAQWRKDWGKTYWWRSYLQVFVLQGVIMAIVSAPLVYLVNLDYSDFWDLGLFEYLGLALFVIGFVFEVVGDAQLRNFKSEKKNKGKIMNSGLWAYTRHPNYFGESLIWWGFYFLAFANGGAATIFSPLLMTYLLLRVSGVAMLERKYKKNRAYQKYVKEVPPFLPFKSAAMYFVFGVFVLLVLWSGISYLFNNVERLEYEVLERDGAFEIRLVEPHIIARTQVFTDEYTNATGIGFQRIAGYIFGGNTKNANVAMTAPVVQDKGEKIAMTAPVVQEKGEKIAMTTPVVQEGGDIGGNESYTISFVMPAEYTMETLPVPDNRKVELVEVPEQKLAVYKFSWFTNEARRIQMEEKLMTLVKEKKLKVLSDNIKLAQYNDPWSPPFMRLNEVWIEIE